MKRTSGVLMHISSLWGDYSCGSFGKSAMEFIDLIKDMGFSAWQVLPFCMVDECNSPYKSYSAFGGNPYFIDLDLLYDEGLLTKDELESARQTTPYSCEYERLYTERYMLLKKAAERARGTELGLKAESFARSRPHIQKFCEFMVLKEANDHKCWIEWTNNEPDAREIFLWQFIQYEFFTQWAKVKSYANQKGISIIGDIPIYVSYDSADVWANKDLFQLNDDGTMKSVAGVPPDYFSADGQLWGNPLYDWDKMASDGYKWWCDRLNSVFDMFDAVRIDHFRALESYWAVPSDAKTAKEGKWIKGPGKAFIDKINSIKKDKLVIAEDLGIITKEVEELVEYSTFPGMRVMQFGFLDSSDSTHLPHNYTKNSVAYTGTHDNNTLLGYVWELGRTERKNMFEYCGYEGDDWNKACSSLIRTMFASSADTLILPIQDILCYGSDTRLNVPGRAEGNWLCRFTKEQILSADKEKFKRLNNLYKR